jgi:hypothetical protein
MSDNTHPAKRTRPGAKSTFLDEPRVAQSGNTHKAEESSRARSDARSKRSQRGDHRSGGARRDRTDDLLLAKQALSQLSYGPFSDQRTAMSDQNESI